ncbi:MAG: AI-2E family transporter [Candidatus Coatesbacteria bacterium]|nr:AI-2E family transporter [Candidatus Coatesbacteria bacterium]
MKLVDDAKVIKISLVTIAIILALGLLKLGKSVFQPFFIALFLSYLFEPIYKLIRNMKVPKIIAVIFILLLASGLLYVLGAIIYSSTSNVTDNMTKYQGLIVNYADQIKTQYKLETQLRQLRNFNPNRIDISKLNLGEITSGFFSSLGSFLNFLGQSVMVLLFMLYIMVGKESLPQRVKCAFEDKGEQILSIIEDIDRKIRLYIVMKTLISLATGICVTIVCWLFSIDFPLLWGMIAFLLNFIPNIGSIIAAIFPIILALVLNGVWSMIIVTILMLMINNIWGNIIEPRVMGDQLDISPLIVLFGMLFGTYIWGIPGAFLATPIIAVIKIILENLSETKPIGVFISNGAAFVPKKGIIDKYKGMERRILRDRRKEQTEEKEDK